MKQIFTTTAILALLAGVAAAEVSLSGDARMGILNDFELDPNAADDTGFTSRARVTFTLSGETDTGLSFGASFRADNAGGAASGTAGSVFVSGAFGKLSMGDVDGAANAAVGHVDGVGLTGLSDLNESSYIANGGLETFGNYAIGGPMTADPTALYEYSANGFGFYASATQPNHAIDTDDPPDGTDEWEGDAYALGANYTVDSYKFSIGYEKLDLDLLIAPLSIEATHWILGADATFGDVTLKARYGKAEVEQNGVHAVDFEQYALSGTYAMGDVSATLFVSNKQFASPAGVSFIDTDAIGLGASYDLGGGAKVVGGIARQKETLGVGPSVSDTAFDLGLSFSF